MQCPRDETELAIEHMHGIEVDHCPTCNGRWLDHHELDQLEATRATEDERRATIAYAQRESELHCPVCGKQMRAFNYRAYDLELDTCEDEHGFWLDGGEDKRVLELMGQRTKDLSRAANAEKEWSKLLQRVGSRSFFDKVKDLWKR